MFVNRWREQPEDVLDLEFEPFQHLYGRLLAAEEKKTQAVSVIQASIGRLKAEGDNSFLLGRAHLSLAKILGDQEKMRAAAQEALRIFTVLGARLDAMEASTMLS